MAETKEGVALELTKIILSQGGMPVVPIASYQEQNVLRVFKACLDATSTRYMPTISDEDLQAI